MSVVVSDLVTRVERRLHMVAGVSVQLYAEDIILHSIQTGFDRLFKKRFWPNYSDWATWTLDGTTGKVTADISSLVKQHTDIKHIWFGAERRPMARLSSYVNPANITGARARFWEPLKQAPTRIFRVIPITSVGSVTVRYRTKPADFDIDSKIYLDPLLIELVASLEYLSMDDANTTAINLVQEALNTYYASVDEDEDDDEIELTGETGDIPTNWYSA